MIDVIDVDCSPTAEYDRVGISIEISLLTFIPCFISLLVHMRHCFLCFVKIFSVLLYIIIKYFLMTESCETVFRKSKETRVC